MRIRQIPVPPDALLQRYVAQVGCHTDCFEVFLPRQIDLAGFVAAFYKTWLFRLERFVLALATRRRITDGDVDALAQGAAERFAVWKVEARATDQMLLDAGKTRSFLMVVPDGQGTCLRFGSAVVAGAKTGERGRLTDLLTPAHLLYSRLLLGAAARRLRA